MILSYKVDGDLELRLAEECQAEEGYILIRQNLDYLKDWLPWVRDDLSLEDVQHFIKQNLLHFAENKGFSLRIIFHGRMAGNIGYNVIDWQNRKTEIGYWIGADYQGEGLVTKACRVLVDHAFSELKLNRVEISCATENRKSRMIPERLGFTFEGVLRQAECVHDRFYDLAMYGMIANEWQTKDKP